MKKSPKAAKSSPLLSAYPNGDCKVCGGKLIAGPNSWFVLHCEDAEWDDYIGVETDAPPVYCRRIP